LVWFRVRHVFVEKATRKTLLVTLTIDEFSKKYIYNKPNTYLLSGWAHLPTPTLVLTLSVESIGGGEVVVSFESVENTDTSLRTEHPSQTRHPPKRVRERHGEKNWRPYPYPWHPYP